jgi:hypothetical protein
MTELEHTLAAAAQEISSLRRDNEILRAKVEVLDFLELLFFTKPNYPTVGMGEDIVWKLQQAMKDAAHANGEVRHA